jgi:hypothetical protein
MSEPMKSGMFTSSNLLVKFVAAAALVSGAVAFTAYVLIGDGNISSDDINTIFDQALQENPELVTTLCEENLNESAVVQAFLQDNSDSSITVDDDVLGTVVYRCTKILVSTTTTDDTTPTSTTTTTYEDEGDNEDYDNEDYDNEDNEEYTVSVTPECDETLSKEYSNDPSQVTVTVVEATIEATGNLFMGEVYPGILLCWEPMLVDNVEPEQYWVSFGYTQDEYIYNDSTYDTGIIFSVGTAGGYINFDGDEPLLTKYFFETEYFFDERELAEKFVENGKLTIYFNIAAYNENTDSSYSDSTKTVSITINDPRD